MYDTSILNAEMPWPGCSLKHVSPPSGEIIVQNKKKSFSCWSGDESILDEDDSIDFWMIVLWRGYKRHKGVQLREKEGEESDKV